MATDDRQRARSMAYQLASDLARTHASDLARLYSTQGEGSVVTALAEPIEQARARFRKKVSPRFHPIFEQAVEEKLVRPVEERIAAEREAEQQEAVREDLGYRTAEVRERPRPRPEPTKKEKPRRGRDHVDPGLADYRQTGTIFVGIGALLTVGMAALALGMTGKERLAERVQTTFVQDKCTMVESRDVRGEGGTLEHVVAFEHEKAGRRYRNSRYSPDVEFGPGASWMPVGKVVDCYCAPDDPAECFLYKGQEKNRESIPWIFIVLFPVLWLGIGFAIRNAKGLPESD